MQQVLAPFTHALFRATQVDLDDLPALYPTVQRIAQDGTRPHLFGGEELLYVFPGDDGSLRPLTDVAVRPYYVDQFIGGDLVLRPRVGVEPIGPPPNSSRSTPSSSACPSSPATTQRRGSEHSTPTAQRLRSPWNMDSTSLSSGHRL